MTPDFIGIDPGKSGAVAVFSAGQWRLQDCPTAKVKSGKSLKDMPDPSLMSDILRPFHGSPCHVFLEKVSAMPKQGVTGMFNFGACFGIWKGIIAAFQMPMTLVTPQRWKKAMFEGMVAGTKDASRVRAIQLFPTLASEMKLKKHHGRADALLIAEYGRRYLLK